RGPGRGAARRSGKRWPPDREALAALEQRLGLGAPGGLVDRGVVLATNAGVGVDEDRHMSERLAFWTITVVLLWPFRVAASGQEKSRENPDNERQARLRLATEHMRRLEARRVDSGQD